MIHGVSEEECGRDTGMGKMLKLCASAAGSTFCEIGAERRWKTMEIRPKMLGCNSRVVDKVAGLEHENLINS